RYPHPMMRTPLDSGLKRRSITAMDTGVRPDGEMVGGRHFERADSHQNESGSDQQCDCEAGSIGHVQSLQDRAVCARGQILPDHFFETPSIEISTGPGPWLITPRWCDASLTTLAT